MFAGRVGQRATAVMLVVGLGIGIWYFWPSGDEASTTTTSVAALAPTTASPPASTTTSEFTTTTSTTVVESHVVVTVAEAEAILRELWFGWFEGIYNQDEDRIREVVATEDFVQAAVAAFDTLRFDAQPQRNGIRFDAIEILRSDEGCLVIWSDSDAEFLLPGPARTGVDVIRLVNSEWVILSSWSHRDDLWEADCDAAL
jgi:hypothetical protein